MDLSVVILSYNVSNLLQKALETVFETIKNPKFEVIVVDNASTDKSPEMVKRKFNKVKLISSPQNIGFSAGNNLARKYCMGKYVLFLNPDTEVMPGTIDKCFEIISGDDQIGAVTCKVKLPDGSLDYSCHRGLPTIWNSFCYWTGLAKLFPNSRLFSGYTATYLSTDQGNYLDCISGTFMMMPKNVLEKIDWWDEDYWWNGEDIEMCWKIKSQGFKIWYEPSVWIKHFKGSSSGLRKSGIGNVKNETKIRAAKSAAKAMRIFVQKHHRELGNKAAVLLATGGIWLLEKYRLFKINRETING